MVKSKPSATFTGHSYKTVPEGHEVVLPFRSAGGSVLTGTSYGEGWENGYHVYLTDSVGGKYVDKGTVGDFRIGEKAIRSKNGRNWEVEIVTAHIYPDGRYDFNVEEGNDRFQVGPYYLTKIR